jgi:hypothetical protein
MKPQTRTLAKRLALLALALMAVAVGILSLPGKVEGFYSAGKLIGCMCDGSDYIRFHKGSVIHYSTAHEPAELIGRYEVKSDGSVEVFMTPLTNGDPEVSLFMIDRPRMGYAFASSPEKKGSCLLVRVPATPKITHMVAKQEVSQVTIPDKTSILTTFYDSSLAVVRLESKPIKKPEAEQAGAYNP